MASSSTIHCEIITETRGWDPKCVSACSMYFPGKEPELKARSFFWRRFEGNLTKGFTIPHIINARSFDFSELRYLFDFPPAFLDEVYPLGKPDTGGRVYFGRLAAEAVKIYNKK